MFVWNGCCCFNVGKGCGDRMGGNVGFLYGFFYVEGYFWGVRDGLLYWLKSIFKFRGK